VINHHFSYAHGSCWLGNRTVFYYIQLYSP